jgi:hypothetical protein
MEAPIPAVASTTSPKAVVERSSASDMREKAAALLQAVRDKNTETYTATAKKKHFYSIANRFGRKRCENRKIKVKIC